MRPRPTVYMYKGSHTVKDPIDQHKAKGNLAFTFLRCFSLLCEKKATPPQNSLQGSQAPVIMLLRGEELPVWVGGWAEDDCVSAGGGQKITEIMQRAYRNIMWSNMARPVNSSHGTTYIPSPPFPPFPPFPPIPLFNQQCMT